MHLAEEEQEAVNGRKQKPLKHASDACKERKRQRLQSLADEVFVQKYNLE